MGAAVNVKIVETFCHQCHMKCHISVHLRDGVVDFVKGATCVKGHHVREDVYHPNRLSYPLRRSGPRGSGRWERITWDEALDTMAARFGEIREKHGPAAICVTKGCAHKENATTASIMFAYLLGTPNLLDAGHLCSSADGFAQTLTIGDGITTDRNVDYLHSKCIVIWGANPPETRIPQARDIYRALRNGARLIVVDPRPTVLAQKADIWLRVRPGTDAALALGIINVVTSEGLYDRDFVRQWCHGFDALAKRAQEYSPDRVAQITWLEVNQIVGAARMFATTKPACVHTRLGPGAQQVNCTQTARAISCLVAIAGNIDVEGGNLLSNDLGGFKNVFQLRRWMRLPQEAEHGRFGIDAFPMQCGTRQTAPWSFRAHFPSGIQGMLDGKVKGLYVCGNNTVVEEADSRRTQEALTKVDFLVVTELTMTPTAALADIVLPAAHWLETEAPIHSFTGKYNAIMATQRVIDPVGECWDDRHIVLELVRRMGLPSPWKSVEDVNDFRLAEVGITFRGLQACPDQTMSFPVKYLKYRDRGFATPTGQVELYSTILEKYGHDPLPRFLEPPLSPISTPEIAKDYPLILIQSRHKSVENSEYHHVPSLRRLMPEPLVEINPATARGIGVGDGEQMWIETPQFEWRIRGKARHVPLIHPNVVSVTHGWYFPERSEPDKGCLEANANAILSGGPPYDPINGNYQVRAVLCRAGRL